MTLSSAARSSLQIVFLALTALLMGLPSAAAQDPTASQGPAGKQPPAEEREEETEEQEGEGEERRAPEPPAGPETEEDGGGEPEVTKERLDPPPQGGKGSNVPPAPKPKPKKRKSGSGVELATGEAELQETDLFLEGVGLDLAWVRTYRSRSPSELDSEQGVQWDHSYNVYLESSGDDLILHPGNGRADRFRLRWNATYAHPDYFVLARATGSGFTFSWPHGGTWNFLPLDGAPDAGRLDTIIDRNGNTIQLNYDGSGRLESLVDTLNRTINVSYGPNGRISAVTDHSGRAWTYSYYTGAGPNGSSGDLKSVTTPTVTTTMGTCSLVSRPLSPANTFALGKTTTFTYSKGFGDERLNHNLLTARQPSGDLSFTNHYAATTDAEDIEFDRLVAQEPGDAGDSLFYHYVDRTNSPAKPRMEVIVNDRRGVVTQYLFDGDRDLLVLRDFTGYADPALPTTPGGNRPTPAGTPVAYKTRYFHNAAGQAVRIIYPEENEELFVYESALTAHPGRLQAGNLRARHVLPGPRGGTQAEIVELWNYTPDRNFVAKYTDPRLGETVNLYDPDGNLLQMTLPEPGIVHNYTYDAQGRKLSHTWPDDGSGHRRVDRFSYGVQDYFESFTRDSGIGQLNLARSFSWTSSGHLACMTDERGNTWEYERNELGRVVRQTGPVMSGMGNARFETDSTYDANDNLVRLDVLNLDETGAPEANTHITTTFTYDTAYNDLVRETREVNAGTTGSTEYDYDASRNVALVRYDGAVSGSDPEQVAGYEYDERDLLFEVQRGQGGPDEATDQYQYDGNGQLALRVTGIEDVGRTTTYTYDGYDRLVMSTDNLGNERVLDYDAQSNLTDSTLRGELIDLPGSAGNLDLSRTSYEYDGIARVTRSSSDWFDSSTLLPIGTGVGDVTYQFSGTRLETVTNATGGVTTYEYDDALRVKLITDPVGNHVDLTYDDADNIVLRTEKHVSASDPPSFHSFSFDYDEQMRLEQRTGPAGPPLTFEYDSRGNLRLAVDERLNTTRYTYDGLDRQVSRERDITDTGLGTGSVVSTQTLLHTYDYEFGLSSMTDSDGNTTSFTYDDLGRRTGVQYADLTSHSYTYDAHDNVVTSTDANGTALINNYDGLGRMASQTITPGLGVANDTTSRTFLRDGAGRLVNAADDDSAVSRTYDSLGNVTEDQILAPSGGGPVALTSQATHDARGGVASLGYPGGRSIDYTRDGLQRVTLIEEGGGAVCSNNWVGPRQRLERRLYPSGESSLFTFDPRLRPSRALTVYGGTTHVDRKATWLTTGQLAGLSNELIPGSDFAYASDSLGRLEQSDETLPNLTVVTETYVLSDAGDRTSAGYTLSAGDAEVHQYSNVPTQSRMYDANGNLTIRDPNGPTQPGTFEYDGLDHLVRFTSGGSGKVTTYAYDPLGRRIRRVRDALGTPQTTLFAYHGRQVIEETNGAGTTLATYVRNLGQEGAELSGLAGGERGGARASANLISMQRSGSDTRLHYDSVGNIAAAVDASSGNLVEWYEYGDFGEPRVFDASNNSLTVSGIGNPYVQQTLRYDVETRLLEVVDNPTGQQHLNQHAPLGRRIGAVMYEPSLARTTSRAGGGSLSIQGANEMLAGSGICNFPFEDLGLFPGDELHFGGVPWAGVSSPSGIGSSGLDGIAGLRRDVIGGDNPGQYLQGPISTILSSGGNNPGQYVQGGDNPGQYLRVGGNLSSIFPGTSSSYPRLQAGLGLAGGMEMPDLRSPSSSIGSSGLDGIMMDGPLHLAGRGCGPQIMPDRPAGWPGIRGAGSRSYSWGSIPLPMSLRP